jgi:hypothetical protein
MHTARVEPIVPEESIDVCNCAAADDRQRPAEPIREAPQERREIRLDDDGVGPLGDINQGAVEVEEQGAA